ncbi:uncharacterized protein E0L32_009672 [Thyridium curvatum]|uniref:Pathway-specific nitrogen regulator n=1 Tax=Thyridium curvatum TaxID=1093900 RepID=A0A507AQS4_9PEZI|nr:uncharacterized protein E0L32_009672 [Thyridium curvatum]TPX08854.1 hypothetical protein E0L32_009672 [Thyridium curvatum]
MARLTAVDNDFKIHVDESCLSTPMEDDTQSSLSNKENAQPVEEKSQSIETEPTAPAVEEKEEETAEAPVEESAPPLVEDSEPSQEEPEDAARHIEMAAEDDTVNDTADSAVDDSNPMGSDEEVDQGGEEDTPITPDDEAGEDNEDNEDTPRPSQPPGDGEDSADTDVEEQECGLQRKPSLRTEALIHAAAKAVVAQLEERDNPIESIEEEDEEEGADEEQAAEGDQSILSHTSNGTYDADGTEISHDAASDYSRRNSGDSHLAAPSAHSAEDVEGGDESSRHGGDDDVFSDRSARSSLGSFSSGEAESRRKSDDTVHRSDDRYCRRSPRVSGISDISQYEKEEFVPAARGTPRPAFRTPSDVRAIQMSSPAPSIFSSPRSGKRHTGHSSMSFPTVSRLGSPTVSAQYSPKGRSTPTRFTVKKEAPLVLLHVTLLPLRWIWGGVINGLDHVKGLEHYEPSEQMKNLHSAWRQLQDRAGDTVLERGILLPHPQNDYEVLEERLLEALELPLRRRARILECGHYLGPSNVMTPEDEDDIDSDDDFTSQAVQKRGDKRHWCHTCRNEIRYEELGEGRIFRVKVFASNGLMKAGAWEACWKEMERIDVELEPILDPQLQGEIEKLASLLQQLDEQQDHEEETMEISQHELPPAEHVRMDRSPPPLHASPVEAPATTTTDVDAARRRRDEERLREIYGHTPPPPERHEATSSPPRHPDSYIPPPSPPSPSEQAYERRETRRRSYQGASLPELALEAAKVLLQDRKNIAILVLSVLIMMLVVRTAPAPPATAADKEAEILRGLYARHQQSEQEYVPQLAVEASSQLQPQLESTSSLLTVAASLSQVTAATVPPAAESVSAEVPRSETASEPPVVDEHTEARNPCETQSVQQVPQSAPSPERDTVERSVVKVFETVTETVKVTAASTEATTDTSTAESTQRTPEQVVETVTETLRVTLTESVPVPQGTTINDPPAAEEPLAAVKEEASYIESPRSELVSSTESKAASQEPETTLSTETELPEPTIVAHKEL